MDSYDTCTLLTKIFCVKDTSKLKTEHIVTILIIMIKLHASKNNKMVHFSCLCVFSKRNVDFT